MSAMWQGVIAVLLIAAFISIAGMAAYQLYGPGIHFDLPDYLLPAGWATTTSKASPSDPLTEYRGTLFVCAEERALKVEFVSGVVDLVLTDGRQIRLTEVAASEGHRYANTDGSFVFWNQGVAASVEEHGEQTYASCLQQ